MKRGAEKITHDDANSEAKMRKKMKEDEVIESALEEKSGRGGAKVDTPQVVKKVDKNDDMAKESVAKANPDSSAKADSSPLTPVVCSRVNDTGSKPVSFTFNFN